MNIELFDIIAQIKNKLAEIEFTENVKVIMAVESGSRAWGFASPDSDYDVRFIYIRTSEDYIRLSPVRDVIEWQLDNVYDVSGWDLQKALRLMHDSNPALHEWCSSPIVYMENELAAPFRQLAAECFLPKKAMYHYLSMAKHNYNTYLTDDEVRIKKYFYALRPVLAARWVADNGTPPPMLFDDLVRAELHPDLMPAVEELVRVKKETSELGMGPKIPELDEYIREQMELMQVAADKAENRKNDKEMIEGTDVADEFEKIYASSFCYDEDGLAIWPAQVVNFTNKTQFLFRISKGILGINDDAVNDYFPPEQLRVPFRNMVYIGDSETDIPCMKLVNSYGGHSIGVYDPETGNMDRVHKMIRDNRIRYYVPADYSEGSEMDALIKAIVDKTAAAELLEDKYNKDLAAARG